ncbi:MAG: glycine/sarcosine/betaine reductase selenoprotein B family protein [Myxococcota bacterium]
MSDAAPTKGGKGAAREVDPWRFAGGFLRRVLSGSLPDEPTHGPIPWTPVTKPIAESKLALLSTAGLSMKDDQPFDMELERKRPTRGDPSWRRLRADATSATVDANHLHIDTGYIERDLAVALPLDRLRELVAAREVGAMADSHYSIMGYQGGDATVLEAESAPAIAAAMGSEEVDLAILAPV